MEEEKKLNVTAEEMKKKFKGEMIWIEVIEALLIVAIIIIGVSTGVSVIQQGTTINTFFNDFLNQDLISSIVGEHWVMDLKKEIGFVLILIDSILAVVLLHNLKKIFKEISETARPFSKTIIKRMERISSIIWVLWFAGTSAIGASFVVAITVSVMVYVFKYGYKLQIESDETL